MNEDFNQEIFSNKIKNMGSGKDRVGRIGMTLQDQIIKEMAEFGWPRSKITSGEKTVERL